MTGETSANGPGDGSIRLVKGPDYDPVYSGRGLPDTFLVPLHNIEQIIVTPSTSPKSDGMLQVVIVPTGATVASAALKDRPEIIHFKWPDRDADESLGGQVATPMVKDGKATYLSVLQAALDQLLAPYDKKVIVYSDEAQAADPSLKFKCSATRTSTLDVNEKAEGSFFFLSTGILWLSQTILYLPFSSLEAVHTIFMRDVASKTPEDGAPIVAMAVLISVSEQFRESQQDQTTANILNFEDVEDFTSMGSSIKKYCEAHGVGFVKLQQTYYNYAAGEMMTGYSPWTNETGG
ncbi:hypothetical protein QQX98_008738 [Neonectria punicea]|uniref:Uncharacterized protein n=1 Tax=Neonectria punicea TaxID=979145 RepID=A0ABR1GUA4_9HYPO